MSKDYRVVRVGADEFCLICDPDTPNSEVLMEASRMAKKREDRIRAEMAKGYREALRA